MSPLPLLSVGLTKVVAFPHLRVKHGCSTRVGGVSRSPFDSLNTGFSVSDDPSCVWENRHRFAAVLGMDNLAPLLSMNHGHQVAYVMSTPAVPKLLDQTVPAPYQADAAITNISNVPLSLTVADCVPVFFYDPVRRCIGLAHAGWRGTVAGIVYETVQQMHKIFSVRPTDLLIGIGPSIGPEAFEVGSEVAKVFEDTFACASEVVRPVGNTDKAFVDLWRANTIMAQRAGVPKNNIQVSGWCTVSHPDLFFSHRRDQGQTGRLLAGIVLEP